MSINTRPTIELPGSSSSAASPDGDVDYHFLMWMAERDSGAGDVPVGTPPREEPPLQTPCGCTLCHQQDNGYGEYVCINCGVVTGSIVTGRDTAIRHSPVSLSLQQAAARNTFQQQHRRAPHSEHAFASQLVSGGHPAAAAQRSPPQHPKLSHGADNELFSMDL